MTREIVLVPAFMVGFMMVSAYPAPADGLCANRAQLVESLADKFQENPTAVGMIDGNAVIEVFVSDNGSFTILATSADGQSCVLSAGEGFEINTVALGEPA